MINGKAVLGAAVGVLAAVGVDAAIGRRAPRHRVALHAAGLATAAAVYPVARSERPASVPVARELLALLGFGAVSAVAAREASGRGARLAAAGWLGHAVFDLVHHAGPHSRLPGWYPAFCAGYDVAVAATLLRRAPAAPV